VGPLLDDDHPKSRACTMAGRRFHRHRMANSRDQRDAIAIDRVDASDPATIGAASGRPAFRRAAPHNAEPRIPAIEILG
jgi:hypothetical protein